MHNNQFAIKNTDLTAEIKELFHIGFLDSDQLPIVSVTILFKQFLYKSFPYCRTESSKNEQLEKILVKKTINLQDFLKQDNLTATEFYTVALQLLGFVVGEDYHFGEALNSMNQLGLPIVEFASQHWESQNLIEAWYLLLNTHTKNGLNFLDYLASQGFYENYQGTVPLFFNGKAQAVVDTDKLIREVVYVETDLDTDSDQQRDLVKVEIIRPNLDSKVATLLTASPYHQGTNDWANDQKLHNVQEKLQRKIPNQLHYQDIEFKNELTELALPRKINGKTQVASETFTNDFSYSLNDFFLSRGFAVAYTTGIGGRGSQGIANCGSVAETTAIKNVVEWLTGQRVAFTDKTSNIAISANFSNGKVAMTGKSYLGTLATATATTAVPGLKAIIAEAAISNWYQYYRDHGLVLIDNDFPGEDADVLTQLVHSRQLDLGDFITHQDLFNAQQEKMSLEEDRDSGNYNRFWDERNYLKNVNQITTDVLIVHGLNDGNVKPDQAYQLWQKLQNLPIDRRIILHQGQHIYINNNRSFDFADYCNLWLSEKLYDCPNNSATILPKIIWQNNTVPEKWEVLDSWGIPQEQKFFLQEGKLSEQKGSTQLSFNDQLPENLFKKYSQNGHSWQKEIVATKSSELTAHRLLFLSDILKKPLLINGKPQLTLKVASSTNKGMISCLLADFGPAQRLGATPKIIAPKQLDRGKNFRLEDLKEFTYAPQSNYQIITRGHINLQNRENPWKNDDLVADQFVEINIEMQPTVYLLPKNRHLELIIYSTDWELTRRGNEDITYTIDVAHSALKIPH
jgi:X-Pro dipeptidyl-peptidase